MRKVMIIALILVGVLFIPSVSAVTVNETEFIIEDTRFEFHKNAIVDGSNTMMTSNFRIVFGNYEDLANVETVFWKPLASDSNFDLYDEDIPTETYNVQLKTGAALGDTIGSGHLTYFKGATTGQSHVRIDIDNIDTALMTSSLISVIPTSDKSYNLQHVYGKTDQGSLNYLTTGSGAGVRGITEIEYTSRFTHTISLEPYNENTLKINIDRGGIKQGSTAGRHSVVSIYDNGGNLLYADTGSSTVTTNVDKNLQPYTAIIESTAYGGKTYTGYLGAGEAWIPPGEEPGDQPVLRKGSVTMTDNNGTSIRGFSVTAVNAYTGNEYTVSTDTDVAVMDIPMDRTTEIRDPWTGEYEVSPVGYYRFYGYAPGYKMLAEDGIQVAVRPEKYGSYELCDILVKSDSGAHPGQRTGTVTMTDNNGTSISGFTVTAVDAYTGQSYTVSTDTDVAVMTLPMDRTIEIRNPQTGEYEEAPVGYYRFYGQAPGYKMLYEDGIQVTVMPEKYGSYELCDIRVTSESGYLSGQHQFQIRSRSDHSVLQTGTISAKSATTGEWYNTTVTDGIATLVLPYDTSNVQSQYAGNYYVYATSPGFEDSDYATQIVVMPHTASEIRYVLLTPIGGIPTPGNVTLRIQAFSESGQGVANANIFISGVLGEGASVWDTYTASSTGYLTVSVPGNSTYDIVASGTGYYDSARRVEVFTEDPGLIEIKLYLSGAPTVEPTTQPTGWVTPTPTQTTPIEEDNLIGLSVKGLAKGFGIDYDTALLMFGLMIIFGAGGMVMSSVNGGAMEFIAGSIVGTFVAFALGLIPIWIFIIIAVVFGAYVLRVFIQGGQ